MDPHLMKMLTQQLMVAKHEKLIDEFYIIPEGYLCVVYTDATSIQTKFKLQQHIEAIYGISTSHQENGKLLRMNLNTRLQHF